MRETAAEAATAPLRAEPAAALATPAPSSLLTLETPAAANRLPYESHIIGPTVNGACVGKDEDSVSEGGMEVGEGGMEVGEESMEVGEGGMEVGMGVGEESMESG
jgi:hypothetical protein